ncbi:Uncharacterised protein [Brevundimonas diminuta]|jgi:hypothetical protein|uniref:DUF4893 domain-containing protein n=2 Tax=Brevundimonas diminuta TaxID=293 RepID=UPI000B4E1919|nr:DUF4893 domain-containing protein [Brevundimonas diminuta]OWR21196.1 DUF4893 domain-containing protein [Brevundimonas diminuta]WQE45417.1 DUF4893 domain-containing protein [Brevundimonas diminuta]SPU44703.1 Uncharacterised protein [Brevundimonas diminuta]SUW14630.1 Uncharacterised protein [Brevundimonas diminuta]
MRFSPVAAALFASVLALAGCDRDAAPTPSPVSSPDAPVAAPSEAVSPPPGTAVPSPSPGEQGGGDDWRAVAAPADASLLGRLDQAWSLARAEAEARGFADEVESLGVLVDPNAGQAGRLQPPPGDYRCRTVKLGAREAHGLAYVAYPAFRCRVELTPGGDLILEKTTGSQRTRGLLYPDTDRRLVYVGAQAWGDETGFPAYGAKAERDQLGVFERIGPQRWRLVIPFPKQESKLDILELTR